MFLSMDAKVSFVAHSLNDPSGSLTNDTRNMSMGSTNVVNSVMNRQNMTTDVQSGFDSYSSL